MFIPVPEERTLQDEIADAEAKNRIEARKLRAQADQNWTEQRFGDDLI